MLAARRSVVAAGNSSQSGTGWGAGGVSGSYSSSRYVPRYDANRPTGTTYDTALGYYTGEPFDTSMPSYTTDVTVTDQGSASANRTALLAAIATANSAANSGGYAIFLDIVTTNWGDEITIGQGSRTGWLIIAPLSVKSGTFVRGVGKRIQSGDAGLAPFRLNATNGWGSPPGGNQLLRTCIRVSEATSKVRLIGLDCQPDATWAAGLVENTDVYALTGFIYVDSTGVAASYAENIVVDRCSISGVYQKGFWRGMSAMGKKIALMNSRITNIGFFNVGSVGDSQAYYCGEGGSGHVLRNNYLANTYGESWMFCGGSDLYVNPGVDGTPLLDRTPSDVLVDGNHCDFPSTWLAASYPTKNLGEWKGGVRCLVQRNLLTGYRAQTYLGQDYAYATKWANGYLQYCITRLNWFRDCYGCFLAESGEQVEYMHNLYDTDSIGTTTGGKQYSSKIGGAPSDYRGITVNGTTVHHNTFGEHKKASPSIAWWLYDNATQRTDWTVESNVVSLTDGSLFQNTYFARDGSGSALISYNDVTNTNVSWTGNVIAGATDGAKRITGDTGVADIAALQLNTDYSPQVGSPCEGKGCDTVLLYAATANVETGL